MRKIPKLFGISFFLICLISAWFICVSPIGSDKKLDFVETLSNLNESQQIFSYSGSPKEIGSVHGNQFRNQINSNIEQFWSKVISTGLSCNVVIDIVRSREKNIPSRYLEELRSLAQATNINYEDLLVLNLFSEENFKDPDDGCTSWVAAGSATRNGNTMLHKNRDMPINPQIIVYMKPEGKYSYITAISAGQITTAPTGINEHGLAAIQDDIALNPLNYNPLGVEGTIFTRSILEDCKNVDEAIDYIINNACLGGTIFMVADSEKGAIIERTGWDYDVTLVEDDVNYRSNHFIELIDTTYEQPPTSLTSARRYEAAKEFFEDRHDNLTVSDFNELSRDHYSPSNDEITEHNSGDGSICNYHTLSGTTYEIDKEYPDTLSVMWVALGHPCSAIYNPIHIGSTEIYEKYEKEDAWNLAVNIFDNNQGPWEGLTPTFLEFEEELIQSEFSIRNQSRLLLDQDKEKEAKEEITDYDLDTGKSVCNKMEDFSEDTFWIDSFFLDFYIENDENVEIDDNVTLKEGETEGELESIPIETISHGFKDATFYAKIIIPVGTNITFKIIDSDDNKELKSYTAQDEKEIEMDLSKIDSTKITILAVLKTNNSNVSPVLEEWGIIGLSEIPISELWLDTTYLYLLLIIASIVCVIVVILVRRKHNIQKYPRQERITELKDNKKNNPEKSLNPNFEYATTRSRIGAGLIDALIITAVFFLMYLLMLTFVFINPFSIEVDWLLTWIIIIVAFFLTGDIYFWVLESFNKGQTVGKKILKLQSVGEKSLISPSKGKYALNSALKGNCLVLFDFVIGLIKNAGRPHKKFRIMQDVSKIIVIKKRANENKR